MNSYEVEETLAAMAESVHQLMDNVGGLPMLRIKKDNIIYICGIEEEPKDDDGA